MIATNVRQNVNKNFPKKMSKKLTVTFALALKKPAVQIHEHIDK